VKENTSVSAKFYKLTQLFTNRKEQFSVFISLQNFEDSITTKTEFYAVFYA